MSHENWYNILTDRLPDSVEVNGKTYPVHTSFRDWISFFFLHEDAGLTDIEKVTLAMKWYRNAIPGNKAAAYQALQEFAACERLPKSRTKSNGSTFRSRFGVSAVTACICILIFCDTIKSTCRQHRCTGLLFNALFEGLPEKSSTKQRIAYRCINIGRIKDKEERKRILQIQHAIAIPQKPMTAAEVGSLFG